MFRCEGETSDVLETPACTHFLACKEEEEEEEEALIHVQSTKRHKSSASSAAAVSFTLWARTRAQKRRMGERDVWGLVGNKNDGVFVSNTFSPEIEFERM